MSTIARTVSGLGAAALAATLALPGVAAAGDRGHAGDHGHRTSTPIKHVVVIFGENVSFDHYFATYPNAANVKGEKQQGTGAPAAGFHASKGTPDDIATLQHDGLLAPNNPNSVQPQRLSPAQAVTCDQDHEYTAEQEAYDGGKMDKFVEHTSNGDCDAKNTYGRKGLTMDYYDGNTVTALWNYAQHYAMSDHAFSSVFGPSTPGALNLVSGQTHGVEEFTADGKPAPATKSDYVVREPDAKGVGTVINDPDPVYDDCSNSSHTKKHTLAGMRGKNIGNLLSDKGVSWGWFQGGFRPTKAATATSPAECLSSHNAVSGNPTTDYNPHHEPFQYYKSTANPHHVAPASKKEIGHDGRANHQYDMTDFNDVVNSKDMPAVSFLKAANYQDGHAGYSDPIDEQAFITKEVNMIQRSKNWKDTAIVLAYDDSDGWYDHLAARLTNASSSPDDAAFCKDAAKAGVNILGGYADRCGPGPRQPLIVVSPYAKQNFVDHRQTDQASILRFIEDNWRTGRIGDSSFDETAGQLDGMFDFRRPKAPGLILDETDGSVIRSRRH